RRELGEAVVLADEDRRQPPEGGDVHRLDEDPALDGAVAEEDDRDRIRHGEPCGERRAEREWNVAADHAGRAEEPVLAVDQMHRPAEPSAEAGVAAHQLRHHRPHWRALRQRVSVGAVPGVDDVVVAELRADPDGYRLLPGGEVDEAVHLVRARELADPLLEGADPPHLPQELVLVYAATGDSSTAATIFAASGRRYCSIGSEYGIVASSAQTSCTGAFSDEKPSEAASAAITAAAEPCRVDWSTTTSRPVFSTDARIVEVSSGASV